MVNKALAKPCEKCGEIFYPQPYRIRRGEGKYCSLSCSGSAGHRNRSNFAGENNPNWKGGRSKRPYDSYTKKYKQENKKKVRCHHKVKKAIDCGELIPEPCEVCGADRVDAHHDDYDKPFEVRWLCRKHHIEHHKTALGTN